MSLLELTIALALTLAITASVFAMMRAGGRASAAQPEVAEMAQRLRVAASTITRDLAMAGAGSYLGRQTAALVYAFPPVLPFRQSAGAVAADPAGSFRADAVTLIDVPASSAQTTLRADVLPGMRSWPVAPQRACPPDVNLCGFEPGMTLLIYDDAGNYEVVTATAVADGAAEIGITPLSQNFSTTVYKAGSKVVEAQLHVYYLKTDAATTITQLIRDAGAAIAVPVVDHVVGLRFDYFGEPRPPALAPSGPTYGPAPPPIGVRTSAYPPGESCLFAADPETGGQFGRLPVIGSDGSLAPLTASQLTDGPWCPDEASANRWDADLLRIRAVMVTLRIESALASLRGPAGLLFANAGTSSGGAMWVPDLEVRFQVTPRNLSVGER
jgi:hypothetical protein